MKTRIYLVNEGTGEVPEKQFLVEASSQAGAIEKVVSPRFTARKPTDQELLDLGRKGVEVIR